jgi:hypothetical protein
LVAIAAERELAAKQLEDSHNATQEDSLNENQNKDIHGGEDQVSIAVTASNATENESISTTATGHGEALPTPPVPSSPATTNAAIAGTVAAQSTITALVESGFLQEFSQLEIGSDNTNGSTAAGQHLQGRENDLSSIDVENVLVPPPEAEAEAATSLPLPPPPSSQEEKAD